MTINIAFTDNQYTDYAFISKNTTMRTTIIEELNIDGMQTKTLGYTPEGLATQVIFGKENLAYVLKQDDEMVCVVDENGTVRCACLNATKESLSAILNGLKERDSSRTLH